MSPDGGSITKLAKLWLGRGRESFPPENDFVHHPLFWRMSAEMSLMLREKLPNIGALRRIADLFDDLAEHSLPQDILGEKSELGATLAFLGWRNSYLLDSVGESQQWVRICDLLVNEPAADFERLEAYLYLPDGQKSKNLSRAFLSTSLDLFLSLAILRRDRLRKPLAVIAAAENIYRLVTSRPDRVAPEFSFFAGEAAWLIAGLSRMLGRRAELRIWLPRAKAELRRMYCRAAFRVRLHLVAAMTHMIEHRHRHLLRRLEVIRRDLHALGMFHDETICRLAIAEVNKVIGDSGSAFAQYNKIAADSRNSSMASVLALCFANIGQFHTESGEEECARAAHTQALKVIDPADLLTLSSVLVSIGSSEVVFGRLAEGARLYDVSAQIAERAGARLWHAFTRVLEAETLCEMGHFASALKALAIAVPVLKSEEMAVEGIHALKILSRIASNSTGCQELVLDLIAQVKRD